MRNALHRCSAGADDAHSLALQSDKTTIGVAAGVGVVPATGMKRVTLEALDASNCWQLGAMQRAVGHAHKTSAHTVAAVGGDDPTFAVVVPRHRGDFGLKARVVVEVEVLTDRVTVRQDLGGTRVLLARDVTDLFEQRKVDVRLNIAHGAGVTVPIPGAAEVTALFDDTNVFDASLTQSSTGKESTKTAADNDHIGLVGKRCACERIDIWIHEVAREVASHFEVLLVAVGTQTLVALDAIFVAQCVGIERRSSSLVVRVSCRHSNTSMCWAALRATID